MESKKRQRRDSKDQDDWEDVSDDNMADEAKPRKIVKARKLAKD